MHMQVNKGVAYADGKILVSTLDTHLYALDAKTGKVALDRQERRSATGPNHDLAPLVVHDKVIVGIAGGEYGVRGYLTAYDLNTGKLAWRAYSVGPDQDMLLDPDKTIDGATQQPVGKDSSLKTWHGDRVETRRRHHLGLVHLRSAAQSGLLRKRQSGNLESLATARRQQMVHYALRAQSRYRRGRMGVSDDSARCLGLRRHQRERAHRQRHRRRIPIPTLTHFDRNGFAYVLDRRNGKLLKAQQIRSVHELGKEIDLKTGRPVLNPDKMTKEDVNVKDICPGRAGRQESPAGFLRSQDQAVLCRAPITSAWTTRHSA